MVDPPQELENEDPRASTSSMNLIADRKFFLASATVSPCVIADGTSAHCATHPPSSLSRVRIAVYFFMADVLRTAADYIGLKGRNNLAQGKCALKAHAPPWVRTPNFGGVL